MKCSKGGKYIPYDQFFTEERVKLYQEGTDEDRKRFFDCDCGEGKMVASLDQKKDEKRFEKKTTNVKKNNPFVSNR